MSVASMRFSSVSSVTTSSDHSSPIAGFVAQRQSTISDGPTGHLPSGASQPHLLALGEDKEFLEFPKFTEEEIKQALKAEAEKHPTWKTAAVKKMKILNINTSVAFRYTLETFTETRSTYAVTEQYSGPNMDTISGASISVWEVQCCPTQMFVEEVLVRELPRSASVTKCETCNGVSDSQCYHCKGSGVSKCNLCSGTGMRSGVPHPLVGMGAIRATKPGNGRTAYGLGSPMTYDNAAVIGAHSAGLTAAHLCDVCGGRGTRGCTHCKGRGKHVCATCGGSGRLKKYMALKIRYELDKSEYLHEAGLSDDIFRKVRGEIIMTETRAHVYPVKNFPIEMINEQSRRLVQSHLSGHQGSAKILQQRHMLEAIPVACVTYDLNGQKGSCWVIGLERMAYVPQYPKKCCIL